MIKLIKILLSFFRGELEDDGFIHPAVKEQEEKDIKALGAVRYLISYTEGLNSCKECVMKGVCQEDMIHCPENWHKPLTEEEIEKINIETRKKIENQGFIFIDTDGLPELEGPHIILTYQGRVKSSWYEKYCLFKHHKNGLEDPVIAYKFDDGIREGDETEDNPEVVAESLEEHISHYDEIDRRI